MTEIRIADDVYAALLDALASAALTPCPSGADVNRDALALALAEVANIIPESLPPIDAETDAAWGEMDLSALKPVSLDAHLAARGLPPAR